MTGAAITLAVGWSSGGDGECHWVVGEWWHDGGCHHVGRGVVETHRGVHVRADTSARQGRHTEDTRQAY